MIKPHNPFYMINIFDIHCWFYFSCVLNRWNWNDYIQMYPAIQKTHPSSAMPSDFRNWKQYLTYMKEIE